MAWRRASIRSLTPSGVFSPKAPVEASDKRAQFVGVEAYEAAGGVVTRDLFDEDGGGWLQDPVLLDRLATEKLKAAAENLSGEGWKWIAVATDFPYGHTSGLRRLIGQMPELSAEEHASREALRSEMDRLEEQYAEAGEYARRDRSTARRNRNRA